MGGAGSPSNTMLPGPRPASVPSGVFIHPPVWPQRTYMGRKLGSCAPLGEGELDPHLTQCGLRAKLHLDPSSCLATIHQRYRQTDRTGQHSTGRTVFTNGRPKTHQDVGMRLRNAYILNSSTGNRITHVVETPHAKRHNMNTSPLSRITAISRAHGAHGVFRRETKQVESYAAITGF